MVCLSVLTSGVDFFKLFFQIILLPSFIIFPESFDEENEVDEEGKEHGTFWHMFHIRNMPKQKFRCSIVGDSKIDFTHR